MGRGLMQHCSHQVIKSSVHVVDHAGKVSGAEAVVDIDDTDAAGTGIEHGQKCGKAAEGGSVSDTCGHCDDRAGRKAADHTCQGALHTGDGNDYAGGLNLSLMVEQAVDSGNSDII